MALFGARARGGHRKRVQRGLSTQVSWQLQVHGKWICPFCCTPALKVPEGELNDLVEAVLDHLDDSCAEFRGGEGQERPLAELRRFAAYRKLRRQVKNQLVSNASWQLIDMSRRWFCPYCGDPTAIKIPKDRKMSEEVLQGIIDHVEACYGYDRGQGQEKPFAHLKAVVRYANQSRKLTENVRRKLEGDPAWRRKDPRNRWVCPYCLIPQEHIDLSSNLLMFENAPGLIAKHLAAACDAFREGAQPKPLESPSSGGSGSRVSPLDPSDAAAVPDTNPKLRPVKRDEDVFQPRQSSPPVGLESSLAGKVPPLAPESQTGSALWGRDGIRARTANKGTTLRELENSGEFLLIDDPEVRSITSQKKSSEERSRAVSEWRREIERELATVNSALPADLGSGSGPVRGLAQEPLNDALAEYGLELGDVFLPADPPQGGFAEAIDLGTGRIALMAGGVIGEETAAALISAQARNLLRSCSGPDLCPSEVLKRVNTGLFADLDGRSFVAVTYILVDLKTARVRLARAGLQAAPVLMNTRRSPALMPLDSEGMVLGIDRGPIFNNALEVRSLELEPGDLLVLFTNGVLEARSTHREEFGLERMHHLVDRYGTHEVAYFTDKFQEYYELHLKGGGRALTDACVVALKRHE